ncbi:MAG TPA: right-handed parallel beta-helix repeat-containing protein [Ktedonobacterales bacterium]|nr:right-handed parallel beta-helix repeat-containing protein [Ktedonobacterales bacterium]
MQAKTHKSGRIFSLVITFVALAFVLTLFVIPQTAHAAGTTYYIDNLSGSNCSNSNAGTSSGAPWCDFAPANSHTFQPGDQILLARGATWYQALYLRGSGTSWNPGAYIAVDAYGTGAAPIIRGNGNASDRTIVLPSNPNYWSINDLELSNAGMGIIANYTTLGNQGLRFNNLYIHDISGIAHASPQQSDFPSIYNSAAITVGVLETGSNIPSIPSANQWVVKDIQITNTESANANGFYFWIVPDDPSNPDYPYTDFPINSMQQMTVKDCYVHNSPYPSMVIEPGSTATILDNRFDFAGHVAESQGTTGAFLFHASTVTWVNNTLENMNDTGSTDEPASDNEGYVDHMTYRGNYIANNAGAGMEFLALSGRSGDYSTSHEVSDNAFSNNGTAGSSTYRSSLLFINQSGETMTGTAANNLYYEPTGFVTGAGSTSWTFTNNLSIGAAANLYNAGDGFSTTQGANQWSYQAYNGSSWSNLTYDSTNQWWGTLSSGLVSRFELLPSACASCWVARAWTAPSSGTVSLRGWVLKADTTGGDGILARITKNGSVIWPTSGGAQSIAYNDQVGVDTDLDSVSVSAGDVIRFEVNAGSSGNNYNDSTSWMPSVGYTATSASGTSLVTAVNLNGAPLRSNFTGKVGMQITVGSSPITVQAIGRYFVAGNSQMHTVEIVRASDATQIASASLNLAAGAADSLGFKYVSLSSPVTLTANTSYYIDSAETSGGDQWYDYSTLLTTTGAASIPSAVYNAGSGYVTYGSTDNSYGPVNLLYTTSFVTGVSTGSQLRNDFGNYVGMKITVGSSSITVQSLGRYFVSGNSGTHTLEIVRASDGSVLGSVSVNMGVGTPDSLGYLYATLSSPITLAANTSYYIVSLEVNGGDQWYGSTSLPSLTATSVAAINAGVYFYNNTWTTYGSSGYCYVPLNFTY